MNECRKKLISFKAHTSLCVCECVCVCVCVCAARPVNAG